VLFLAVDSPRKLNLGNPRTLQTVLIRSRGQHQLFWISSITRTHQSVAFVLFCLCPTSRKKSPKYTGILFLARPSKCHLSIWPLSRGEPKPRLDEYIFFSSVPVFTTCLTVICPSPSLFGLFVFFSSPWSRDISFFVMVYYSCLFSQTVCTVLLSQYFLHEPVLWTSSLPSPEYFSIPSDWRRVPNI